MAYVNSSNDDQISVVLSSPVISGYYITLIDSSADSRLQLLIFWIGFHPIMILQRETFGCHTTLKDLDEFYYSKKNYDINHRLLTKLITCGILLHFAYFYQLMQVFSQCKYIAAICS